MTDYGLYPGGKKIACTFSYDDGTTHDRRLVELFDQYGMKATFHLNSGCIGKPGYLEPGEIKTLFQNHEISAHGLTHPWLTQINIDDAIHEIIEDKINLEQLCGKTVRGMSYPYGDFNEEVVRILPSLGIEYARTTIPSQNDLPPENFLKWHPTLHHNDGLEEKLDQMLRSYGGLLYIWGHSHEFHRDNNWEVIEQFCRSISSRKDLVWFATNIEVMDYIKTIKR